MTNSRSILRKTMRARRRTITPFFQRRAADKLAKLVMATPEFLKAKHIALYLAYDGEISPHYLVERLRTARKQIYLPVLHPAKPYYLWFQRYRADTQLVKNQYGILEPALCLSQRLQPKQLDLVFLPLVAFDEMGGRLGMGGGYYDRTFAFSNTSHCAMKPKLIGLAHECQRVSRLDTASWDIPMHAVITDQKIYYFSGV